MIPLNVIILASAFGALFPLSVYADVDMNKEVGFYVYTREAKDGVEVEIGDDEEFEKTGFQTNVPTKIIIHGLDDDSEGPEISQLKDAYLEKTIYNVIMVDWSGIAEHYSKSRRHAKDIGQHIGKFILYLTQDRGVLLGYIHIIGFELGAHIAGFVSDVITGPKVPRITGLDPMGFSEWENAPANKALDKHDATLVDVFHTSKIGILKPIGDVDFYPNGGVNQTGCTLARKPVLCDNLAAIKFYVDSISSPEKYIGVRCTNVEEARDGTCSGEEVQLGEFIRSTATDGIYYKAI